MYHCAWLHLFYTIGAVEYYFLSSNFRSLHKAGLFYQFFGFVLRRRLQSLPSRREEPSHLPAKSLCIFTQTLWRVAVEEGTGRAAADRGGRGSKAPPSRHLWIGNLSHGITEDDLTRHFLNFGDLESVAFQPGRSYAFINFKTEEDARAAMEALNGFPVAGNPLRVEFTKADKSSVPSREEDYSQRRDEQHSAVRGSPLSQREFRARQDTPEQLYQEKSSMGDKNTEPSEVLWIGFPALLKVDEFILRKSFAPFGEIEKITAFPGRSYASDNSSSNSGRNSSNDPPPPHGKFTGRSGSSENFRQDRNFGSLTEDFSNRSPQYFPTLDSGGYEPYSLKRKGNLWTGEDSTFEQRRPGEISDLGHAQEMYGYRGSPTSEKYSHLHDYSQRFPQINPPYEEPWDLPDDIHYFHGAKKLKIESYIPEKELPEYPMSVYEQEKLGFPRFTDFHQADNSNRNFEADPFGYKQIPERPINLARPPVERGEPWKESYIQPGSQLLNSVDRKRFTPESKKSLELWKWEGTIANGGTPVCRARCFPVGKVLDIILPEVLDCTARTGLDMLSKHYDQATSAWVVFFAPGSDADIGYYNEFMQYLGEKQRAAVAKLDDRTTLFLVPPSEFSEKVLKEHPSVMQRPLLEAIPTGGMPLIQNSNFQDTQPSVSLPMPLVSLQPEQLARLASLLEQQKQSGSIPNPSTGEDFRHRNAVHETENLPRTYQKFTQQNNQVTSVPSTSQFGQAQELQQPQQQVSYVPHMVQRDPQAGGQVNQHLQNINANESGETDRMQATLQLAAALLQQIQQGKGS
ncbi:hypothetical protein ACLB2K_067307 [Fragaria x ananassa]